MPRVARAWPAEANRDREELNLGKPRATRRQAAPPAESGAQVLRLSGQVRNQRESGLRAGTAFDLSSNAWMPLRRAPNGSFRLGQDEQEIPAQESAPPPPGGTQAGPAPEPGTNLTLAEAEAILEELDRSIAKVSQATAEDLARCENSVDTLVLADARAFRARLFQELARPGAMGVTATMREIHAAELVSTCAQALSSIRLRTFAVVGAIAVAFGVVVFGLS
jgi:hypothetical protein